jgi:tryptophan halogenase
LFTDHALALQVPYEQEDSACCDAPNIYGAGYESWIWDDGLPTRRGTGYVYSSNHVSHDEAGNVAVAYGIGREQKDRRRIKIRRT